MSDFFSDKLSVWGAGQLLAFSGIDGQTDSRSGLTGRTAFGYCGIDILLPAECRLTFFQDKPQQVTLGGDFFQLEYDGKCVKGAFVDAWHLLIEGPCDVLDCDGSIVVIQNRYKTLIAVEAFARQELINMDLDEVMALRQQWLKSLSIPADMVGPKKRTLYKALSMLKTQIYAPEGKISHYWSTPDRWPHRDMWLWDSVFHAIGLRHISANFAKDILSAVFEMQHENGFIPHQGNPYWRSDITQPPVLVFGVALVDELESDDDWLANLFPKLEAYLQWNCENRDSDGKGLLEWFIEEDENCRSGESGMDNSPRFDQAIALDAVDFNSFMALEYNLLANFAERLGYPDKVARYELKYKRMCELINNYFWHDELGFYVDYDQNREEQSCVMAGSGFLPLICGAATSEQAATLVAHLNNAETFGTPLPVPSIAVSATESYSKDMWRGPVWINMNWLIAYGLKQYGYQAEADRLIQRTVEVQTDMYQKYGSIFEFYDDRCEVDPPELQRKGRNAPHIDPLHQVLHDFGWSGTLFIDMLLQE